jgi:hypothetical protein
LIVVVPWYDMDVKVPNILPTRRLVVLNDGHSRGSDGVLQRER